MSQNPTKRLAIIRDQAGAILTMELVIVASILLIGIAVGLSSVRDAMVSELSDTAGGFQDMHQSFRYTSASGPSSNTAGSSYQDGLDFAGSAGDRAGLADNCISLAEPPRDEDPNLPTFTLSGPGVSTFTGFSPGVGGSAVGTIGDATINTGFTVTTDTGNIVGTTGGTELRFRETNSNNGSFTITYDEPITEFEFWIRNLSNILFSVENLLGNFTLELSDGTLINNAAFNILPDAIAPNQNYGLFSTGPNETQRVIPVTRGGAEYVTDPFYDGTAFQAAGRLVFPDIPNVGNPAAPGAVGLRSLIFERSGGASGYQANFSTSGRVLREDP